MAIAAVPTNFIVQQANGQAFLSWAIAATATGYSVQRSTDGVNFTTLASPTLNSYLDTTVTVGTQYFYQVASVNGSGTSAYTAPLSVVPTYAGQLSLGEIRTLAQQRADMINSNFVSTAEWNSYINQSYFELYDLLVTVYEDYYLAPVLSFSTDGVSQSYALPNGQNYSGAKPFYKLMGVDCGLGGTNNAWVTLKKYEFIERNRYVYPSITSTFLGVFNMAYRIMGNNLMFIPTPSGGQQIQVWYIPRLTELLQDTDIADGVSGWTEYVICDAAIKAMQKEESDVSVLIAEKMALKQRIEESAMNRDAGQPDKISDTRNWGGSSGRYGAAGFDGGWGGY